MKVGLYDNTREPPPETAMATAFRSSTIEAIAGDDANPVLRNLRITLAYYDLSQLPAAVIHALSSDPDVRPVPSRP